MERATARFDDLVPTAGIVWRLSATDAKGVVIELASKLAQLNRLDPERVQSLLLEREQLGTTAIGNEVGVPHAKCVVPQVAGVLGLSPAGSKFGATDGQRVRVFVAFLFPSSGAGHLKALAAAAKELVDPQFSRTLLAAKDATEVHALLSAPRRDARPASG